MYLARCFARAETGFFARFLVFIDIDRVARTGRYDLYNTLSADWQFCEFPYLDCWLSRLGGQIPLMIGRDSGDIIFEMPVT